MEEDKLKKALKEVDQFQKGEFPKKLARQFLVEQLANETADLNGEDKIVINEF